MLSRLLASHSVLAAPMSPGADLAHFRKSSPSGTQDQEAAGTSAAGAFAALFLQLVTVPSRPIVVPPASGNLPAGPNLYPAFAGVTTARKSTTGPEKPAIASAAAEPDATTVTGAADIDSSVERPLGAQIPASLAAFVVARLLGTADTPALPTRKVTPPAESSLELGQRLALIAEQPAPAALPESQGETGTVAPAAWLPSAAWLPWTVLEQSGGSGGVTSIRVRIDVPELGSIDLHVSATSEGLSCRLLPRDECTWRNVQSRIESLRQGLLQAGIRLSNLEVEHASATAAQDVPARVVPARPRQNPRRGHSREQPVLPATPTEGVDVVA